VRTWALLIFIFSFSAHAIYPYCSQDKVLDDIIYPGRSVRHLNDINPGFFWTFTKPPKDSCYCEMFNHIRRHYSFQRGTEDSEKRRFEKIYHYCSIYDQELAVCPDPNNFFYSVMLDFKPEQKAIKDYNLEPKSVIEPLRLEMKKGDEVCHRHPENILGIVIHHTASIYISKHNLKKIDYSKSLESAFDKDELTRIKNSKWGTTLIEDFTSNDPKGYVKVVHQEFQNGMQKWSGIPYHYLVTYNPASESWTTIEARPVNLVGAHAGAGRPLSLYPPKRYPDPAWRNVTLKNFAKGNGITLYPKRCETNGVSKELPLGDNWNDFAIGVVVKGHFAKIKGKIDPLNPTVYKAAYKDGLQEHLLALVKELKRKFPNISKVVRHGDITATACPGTLGGAITDIGHTRDSNRGLTGILDKAIQVKR
jgi:hypothetical protein